MTLRVYQSIHCYPKHLEGFEIKYGEEYLSQLTFKQLQSLVIKDGYASAYILKPAFEANNHSIFFTIWDYSRLQYCWAKENGVNTLDLDTIRYEQIKQYKPNIIYDFSAWKDRDFLQRFPIDKSILTIAWNGLIHSASDNYKLYDGRLTLHRPYIDQWSQCGLLAAELQPSIDDRNGLHIRRHKEIDFLFYGQWGGEFFSHRSMLAIKLLKAARKSNLNICVALSYDKKKIPLFSSNVLRRYFSACDPPKFIQRHSHSPLYGEDLYAAIGKSKFVINAYTDNNKLFKSNMRAFEALSGDAILVSERGNYPEGFASGSNYIDYGCHDELLSKLHLLSANYKSLYSELKPGVEKLRSLYSKDRQWDDFQSIAHAFAERLGKRLA